MGTVRSGVCLSGRFVRFWRGENMSVDAAIHLSTLSPTELVVLCEAHGLPVVDGLERFMLVLYYESQGVF